MTNIELQYETIHSDTLARSAMAEYSAGKAFLYDHVTLYRNFSFLDKTDELITQTINPTQAEFDWAIRDLKIDVFDHVTANVKRQEVT